MTHISAHLSEYANYVRWTTACFKYSLNSNTIESLTCYDTQTDHATVELTRYSLEAAG